jgi:hypothetical protein
MQNCYANMADGMALVGQSSLSGQVCLPWITRAVTPSAVRDGATEGTALAPPGSGQCPPAGELVDVRRLTKAPAQVGHPRFSPDGLWIVYTSGEGGLNDEAPINTSLMFSPQSYGEIWAYRLADGLRVRLTHDKWEDGEPFWAPPASAASP